MTDLFLTPEQQTRRALRRDANCIGLGMVFLFALMSFLYTAVVFLLAAFLPIDITDPFLGLGNTAYLAVYSVVYTLMMGVPMVAAALIFRVKVNPFRPAEPTPLWRGLLWLVCGLGVCMAANFVTNFIMIFLTELGVQQPVMPDFLEKTPLSLVLNIVVFAVLPGVLEEMFFRGYVLQMLRRYNDTAALFISSLLFALMHGNVLQIPFAFMVGIVLGLIVLRTENIWLAVGLHFLNNALSLVVQYLGLYSGSEEEQILRFLALSVFLLVLGAGAGVVLLVTRRRTPRPAPTLEGGKTFGGVLRSPLIIVSVSLFVLLTLLSVAEPYLLELLERLGDTL